MSNEINTSILLNKNIAKVGKYFFKVAASLA